MTGTKKYFENPSEIKKDDSRCYRQKIQMYIDKLLLIAYNQNRGTPMTVAPKND